MMVPAIATIPAITSQGEPILSESMDSKVPSRATNPKVRSPALAEGLRSRSSPISRPMARLVRNCGRASIPCTCRKAMSILNTPRIQDRGLRIELKAEPLVFLILNPCSSILYFVPVADEELQALRAIVFIDAQTVHGVDAFRQ